ncbi:uncharacterized protein LOC130786232 [Actinidia eriantha]|uniref:uncharacterized protein LOC130786232 n=1 Tax=Actinidia eriantha TaxID=165200 RepID=UPI002585B38A|nr:uncharacterized protein LOC130786232 [Actinidia eriantha]
MDGCSPVCSFSGCDWIWRPVGEETREGKMVAKPGRWREEGEEIQEMAKSGAISGHQTSCAEKPTFVMMPRMTGPWGDSKWESRRWTTKTHPNKNSHTPHTFLSLCPLSHTPPKDSHTAQERGSKRDGTALRVVAPLCTINLSNQPLSSLPRHLPLSQELKSFASIPLISLSLLFRTQESGNTNKLLFAQVLIVHYFMDNFIIFGNLNGSIEETVTVTTVSFSYLRNV